MSLTRGLEVTMEQVRGWGREGAGTEGRKGWEGEAVGERKGGRRCLEVVMGSA